MKRILLFLICCYVHTDITSQTLPEQPEESLLEQVETFIEFSEQEGLATSTNGQLDSMRISRMQENTGTWENYKTQQNYYHNHQLGKQLLLAKLENEPTWTRQELQEYHYDGTVLKRQFAKKWNDEEWDNHKVNHFQYETEQELVKSYQQQWSEITNNWEDEEVSEHIYQQDGKKLGVRTAHLPPNANTWQNKDYMAYVYKSELPWISQQIYKVWDIDENKLRNQYLWDYQYSDQNILKSAIYYYWEEATKTWIENGRVQHHYNTDLKLEALLFQEKTGNTWQDLKLYELFWSEVISSNEPPIAETTVECQFPNPYQSGDRIHYQGAEACTFVLYDYMGKQLYRQALGREGALQLPATLPTGYYVLIIKGKRGEALHQDRLVVGNPN